MIKIAAAARRAKEMMMWKDFMTKDLDGRIPCILPVPLGRGVILLSKFASLRLAEKLESCLLRFCQLFLEAS